MGKNILKLFLEKGFLLDREVLDFLNELEDEEIANEIINKIAIISKQKLITKNLVNQNLEKIKPFFSELDNEKKKLIERFFVNVSISVEVKKETVLESDDGGKNKKSRIKIISSPIPASQKLEVKDFIRHFRNRFVFLKNILQKKTELENLTSIDKLGRNHRNFSIIGIVTSKSVTKNKNIILEVEDLTDRVKLLINQNKEEIFNKAKKILLDDVIGFKCSGNKEFLFANDIIYPDSFMTERNQSEREVYAVFISDIHIGSTNFLEKNFQKFIEWLNGKGCDEKQKEILSKIRYLFVVGDNVDGVGVYPGQEKFLNIKDIKEQYNKLAEYFRKIPEHINIIMCPGQHDGVRVAEPQPPIGDDFGEALHKIPNLYLVSNPSLIEVETRAEKSGIKVLMYHGASFSRIINDTEELRLGDAFKSPTKVVKHLLLRRHLAPVHGEAIYIPNAEEDSMLIKEIPNIVATGDLHKADIDKYNGILLIASSCWQSTTPFEEKVGNHPDPCKVPVLNLQTGAIKIIDFSENESEEEKENVCDTEKKDFSVSPINNIITGVKNENSN